MENLKLRFPGHDPAELPLGTGMHAISFDPDRGDAVLHAGASAIWPSTPLRVKCSVSASQRQAMSKRSANFLATSSTAFRALACGMEWA